MAAFWLKDDRSGVPWGELLLKDAGDEESLRRELPVIARPEARDLRSPWAEEGRPGEEEPGLVVSGGADGDQSLPASAASS